MGRLSEVITSTQVFNFFDLAGKKFPATQAVGYKSYFRFTLKWYKFLHRLAASRGIFSLKSGNGVRRICPF